MMIKKLVIVCSFSLCCSGLVFAKEQIRSIDVASYTQVSKGAVVVRRGVRAPVAVAPVVRAPVVRAPVVATPVVVAPAPVVATPVVRAPVVVEPRRPARVIVRPRW